jgi:phosphohistidine phosphatase
MSKILYLARHAKSDWSIPGQKDFERELNTRGLTDAPKMGRILHEKHVLPDIILSSPAVRAKHTAELMAEQLQYDLDNIVYEEELYEASVRSLLLVINRLDSDYQKVMIFGHNPSLTYLAEFLTKEVIGNIPTSGILEISLDIDSWEEVSGDLGTLNWFIYPKLLFGTEEGK